MFVCDTCRREYTSKKSLTRHVKEKHVEFKHYPCALDNCNSKFIRRSYLITHLKKIHKLDRETAKRLSSTVKLVRDSPPPRTDYEEISEDEEFFNSLPKSPYKPIIDDISDDESLYGMVDNLIYDDHTTTEDNNNNKNSLQSLVDSDDEDNVNSNVDVTTERTLAESDSSSSTDINYVELIQAAFEEDDGVASSSTNTEDVERQDDAERHSNASVENGNSLNCESDTQEDFILISSDDENEETIITSINITLTKTEKIRKGEIKSITRSASVGYSENLCPADITSNLKNIFDIVQNEFKEYASYYHNHS